MVFLIFVDWCRFGGFFMDWKCLVNIFCLLVVLVFFLLLCMIGSFNWFFFVFVIVLFSLIKGGLVLDIVSFILESVFDLLNVCCENDILDIDGWKEVLCLIIGVGKFFFVEGFLRKGVVFCLNVFCFFIVVLFCGVFWVLGLVEEMCGDRDDFEWSNVWNLYILEFLNVLVVLLEFGWIIGEVVFFLLL